MAKAFAIGSPYSLRSKMAKDPVCRMDVDEKKAKFKSSFNGVTYYFCCAHCKAKFDGEPTKYPR
jgi:YHS domain-containing protein